MSRQDCSIIVLAHNGAEFTRQCLTNILQAVDKPKELFLVNNGSTDNTAEVIQEFIPKFEVADIAFITWCNKENKGCSEARNDAWEKASCKYVVLMDNDAAVCTADWLSKMVGIMENNPKIGILGPKMIYPFLPHKIQCAGVLISPLGRIAFRGRGADRNDPRYSSFRSVHLLISACWIMPNKLKDEIGYLDKLFHPVQYEDLDLCFKASQAGYQIAYTPDVEIYHFEGMTTASFGDIEYQRNIAKNSLKFRERWNTLYKRFTDELTAEEYRWLKREELGLVPKQNTSLVFSE